MKVKVILRIKPSVNPENVEFTEGMGAGVLVEQEVEFDVSKFIGEHGKFNAFQSYAYKFIKEYIEVTYEEIEEI